jgi:hypothetical protein
MSPTKSTNFKRRRKRDFKAEYQRRKAKGLAANKSLSAARGHPKAADLPKPPAGPISRDDPRERALKLMRHGASQAKAAKVVGIPVERLRLYRELHTTSQRRGREWIIFDSRPQPFWLATGGKLRSVVLPNDEGTAVSRYWSAVNDFLDTNDTAYLAPFRGEGVRDVNGRTWFFETGPNTLRRLESADELGFAQIYADTVGEA